MLREVYIYNDIGTSKKSVDGLALALKNVLLYPSTNVHLVKASGMISALTAQDPTQTVLIVPGGADLPYVKMLDTKCISVIREVVGAGGCYIGICAGAYFASSHCVFEKDDPVLRVVGPRPLSLFPHPAIGAVREKFCYGSKSGATVERLNCEWRKQRFEAKIYCNGAPAWDVDVAEDTTIIARYADPVLKRHGFLTAAPVAALRSKFGEAGTVVLCGVHPELPLITEPPQPEEECDDKNRNLFLLSVMEAASIVKHKSKSDSS